MENGGPPTADMDGSVGDRSIQGDQLRRTAASAPSSEQIPSLSGNFGPREADEGPMNVFPPPRQSSAASPAPPPTSSPVRPPPRPPIGVPPRVGKAFAGVLAASRAQGARCAAGAPSPPARSVPPGLAAPPGRAGPDAIDAEKGPRGGGHDDGGAGYDDARELELLDPATRHAASLAPPLTIAAPASAAAATEAPLRARSLEELLPALVRRVAWAGDKHNGTVRLELGAGAYAGTIVVVHADGGRVRVELSGTEGPELDRLRVRLDGRLRGHGLDVESVT